MSREDCEMNVIKTEKKSKVFAFLTLVLSICIIMSISSCASNMTDDEARKILEELVPLSQNLNDIFWGEGLPVEDSEDTVDSVKADQYRPVTDAAEYKSVEEIKDAAEKVFSSDYLVNSVYPTVFGEYNKDDMTKDDIQKDDGYVYDASDLGLNTIYPRYKQERDGILYRNVSREPYELNTEIRTDTAVVKKRANNLIICEVECVCSGVTSKMDITLRYQDGVWLLDGPTY